MFPTQRLSARRAALALCTASMLVAYGCGDQVVGTASNLEGNGQNDDTNSSNGNGGNTATDDAVDGGTNTWDDHTDSDPPPPVTDPDSGTSYDGALIAPECEALREGIYTGDIPYIEIANFSQDALDELKRLRQEVTESRTRMESLDRPHYQWEESRTSWTGYTCELIVEAIGEEVIRVEQTVTRYDHEAGDFLPAETTVADTAEEIAAGGFCLPILTLSQMYDTCLNEVLCWDPIEANVRVSIDPETGLLNECNYFPPGCADDCMQGFRLQKLELL